MDIMEMQGKDLNEDSRSRNLLLFLWPARVSEFALLGDAPMCSR